MNTKMFITYPWHTARLKTWADVVKYIMNRHDLTKDSRAFAISAILEGNMKEASATLTTDTERIFIP